MDIEQSLESSADSHRPTPEEVNIARRELAEDLRLHLERKEQHEGHEGRCRMIAWRILIARTLLIDDCVRGCVNRNRVEDTLKKIEGHRDCLNRVPFLRGKVLCISGSTTVDEELRKPQQQRLQVLQKQEEQLHKLPKKEQKSEWKQKALPDDQKRQKLEDPTISRLASEDAIAINYKYVQEDWIRQYFAKRLQYFRSDRVDDHLYPLSAENPQKSMSPLQKIQGEIQKIQKTLANIDWQEREYGSYLFMSQPVLEMFNRHVHDKTITGFHNERLKKCKTVQEAKDQKKELLRMITKEESPATFIFDGHGTRDLFYFHRSRYEGGLTVDELVGAFFARAKKTHHLPIGLMNGEYGQNSIKDLSGFQFYRDILGLDRRGGATVGEIVQADEERRGLNNIVLYVPGMYSSENTLLKVPYDTVDRIIFTQCEGMDFAVSFYRELQRRLGGKEYYLPITRREERKRGDAKEKRLA